MYKVLVYGWYFKKNIGDDLFIEAFQHIFPTINFTFTDKISISSLKDCDAIFIGGGSFLDSNLVIEKDAWDLLLSKKIFYIGVGNETNKSKDHLLLLAKAKLIAVRNSCRMEELKAINKNIMIIPDIVSSLMEKISLSKKIDKSVLVIPNSVLIPQNKDSHWKFAAWDYFKSEFSQFLDHLVDDGYKIKFFSMCNNNQFCDTWAAIEISNLMKSRDQNNFIPNTSGFKEVSQLISQFEFVITQRFHGIILANMCQTPYISLYHHDKLKSEINPESNISFYNLNKNLLLEKFYYLHDNKGILPIELDIFIVLKNEVLKLLGE